MKKLDIRRAAAALFAACLPVLTASLPASAADIGDYDPDHVCSLTLRLDPERDAAGTIVGMEIALYRVADISFSGGEIQYTFTEDFVQCPYDPNQITSDVLAGNIFYYAETHSAACTLQTVTNENSAVVFDSLTPGLYLTGGTKAADISDIMMPFLVTLPMTDEDEWLYDVTAEPKIGSKSDSAVNLSVQKVWVDDGANRPDSIAVSLTNELGIYETVVLSEENSWYYEWNDLPSDSDWQVLEPDVPEGYTASYSEDDLCFTITNTQNGIPNGEDSGDDSGDDGGDEGGSGGNLWQTGQENLPVTLLACGGILLIAGGLMMISAGRRMRRNGTKYGSKE